MTDHETGGATAAERIEAARGRVLAVGAIEELENEFLALRKGFSGERNVPSHEAFLASSFVEKANAVRINHSAHLSDAENERVTTMVEEAASLMEERAQERMKGLRGEG